MKAPVSDFLSTKRRSEKSEEMRKRIIDTSIDLFLEQGYEKTTTRQIIQKVGILNGSLYNIYKSKEAIFTDIIMMALNDLMEQIPKRIKQNSDGIDLITYALCLQLYVANHSQKMAEMLCFANENWEARSKVDELVMIWVRSTNEQGHLCLDVPAPMYRLSACAGAAYLLTERMAHEPGGIDDLTAMTVVVEIINASFHKDGDPKDTAEELLGRFSETELVLCGHRII